MYVFCIVEIKSLFLFHKFWPRIMLEFYFHNYIVMTIQFLSYHLKQCFSEQVGICQMQI